MDKKVFETEKEYLGTTFNQIEKLIAANNKKILENKIEIQNLKAFFSDQYYEIKTDGDELANLNIEIENLQEQNVALEKANARLKKQKKTPYFGRFDFQETSSPDKKPYYIGVGAVQSSDRTNLVYDWRADICSLYYDEKFGKVTYTCPDGEISGNLSLKRQYKIENGELAYYIDSNLVIDDEILMEQLSQNATAKMHEIVSTIQKEQNMLIRADDFENTIVQGVAGSGKTSIAMHRVSYLLYKYRGTLKSDDILILSPSELFSNYLSDVLPSLGEEEAMTITFSDLAHRLLGSEFETREAMLERVIDGQQQKDFENIAIKSSFEFLSDLQKFLSRDLGNLFVAKTVSFGNVSLTKEEIEDIFCNRMQGVAIYKRIDVLAEILVDKFKVSVFLRPDLIRRAKAIFYRKFVTTDILKIYNLFLGSVELPEISTPDAYDVAPMLLIKESLFGFKHNFSAKYVIVDEMQDYTPCHFYLFDKLWECPKLYLGDIYQSIDRTLPKEYLTHLSKLCKAKVKFLNRSYRSTKEISLFSQKILGKSIANNVNRSGEDVEFLRSRNQIKTLEKIIAEREKSHRKQSVAIICKTKKQISALQKASPELKKFKLLEKATPRTKKIITTPAKAKGVEFDCVIVPNSTEESYNNELDRNLLYVSATRALHKLFFISDKKPSHFLTKN